MQPLELETDTPAAPNDGLDEFDLEYFSEENVQPDAAGSPAPAFGEEFPEEDVVDLESDMETLLDGQRGIEEEVPAASDTIDVEDIAAARVEDVVTVEDEWPAQASSFDDAAPPAASATNEAPPWAVEMREELQRLRAENSVLREALRGITTLLDRQIGVLQDGRDELDRRVGEIPGENAP